MGRLELVLELLLEPQAAIATAAIATAQAATAFRNLIVLLSSPHPGVSLKLRTLVTRAVGAKPAPVR
jgi:hypothetical protein